MTDTFEQVYEEYYPRIRHYLMSKLGDYYQAEELAQEVMVLCYKNWDTYDAKKAKVGTWVFVIANNRLKNYYRDKKDSYSLDESFSEVYVEDAMDESVLLEEQVELLYKSMETLNTREQFIIKHKYFEEENSLQIARHLGITEGNVRVILKRAIDKLEKQFRMMQYEA